MFNAATEAQVGPSASRIPKMVWLWRYLTAVPANHAPARSCAMRKASTARAYIGAGPSEPSPGGRLGGGLIVATAPSRGLSQETRTGGALQTTPTSQVSEARWAVAAGNAVFPASSPGVVPGQDGDIPCLPNLCRSPIEEAGSMSNDMRPDIEAARSQVSNNIGKKPGHQ